MKEYPIEIYIQLESLAPYYKGQITVFRKEKEFSTEVAVVSAESGKIFQFIGSFYKFEEEKEAIDYSVQKLADHFKKLKAL